MCTIYHICMIYCTHMYSLYEYPDIDVSQSFHRFTRESSPAYYNPFNGYTGRVQLTFSNFHCNNSVISEQCVDHYKLCFPVGVAGIWKTANCSWRSANTHIFVQMWSHPLNCNATFPYLTVNTRQQSDLHVCCGEKQWGCGVCYFENRI